MGSEEEYWGEEGEPVDEWAKPIIARGPRQAFEMEQSCQGRIPTTPTPTRSANPTTSRTPAKAGRRTRS